MSKYLLEAFPVIVQVDNDKDGTTLQSRKVCKSFLQIVQQLFFIKTSPSPNSCKGNSPNSSPFSAPLKTRFLLALQLPQIFL